MKRTDIIELTAAKGAVEPSAYRPSAARSEIGLREPLSGLEWDWLNALLLSTGGVRGAVYLTGNRPRVLVNYDEASLDGVGLLDLFYLCGVCPKSTMSLETQ